MITTLKQAKAVQARRYNAGRPGFAKAVRRLCKRKGVTPGFVALAHRHRKALQVRIGGRSMKAALVTNSTMEDGRKREVWRIETMESGYFGRAFETLDRPASGTIAHIKGVPVVVGG